MGRGPRAARALTTALGLWMTALLGVAATAPPRPAPPGPVAVADTVREAEIVNADRLEQTVTEDGQTVRRLIGHVQLVQDSTLLWADEALEFADRNEYLITGNVRIVEGSDSLWADTVLYNELSKIGEASGNVRLSDGEVLVRAPYGRYFTREKQAFFERGVTLVDSLNTLTSRGGQYDTDAKRAEFYGDVRLAGEGTTAEADSITYLRETQESWARGEVFILRLGEEEETDSVDSVASRADSLTRTVLFGDRAYTDERIDFSRIDGNALLVQLRTDTTDAGLETDTLLLRADVLEASRADTLERLIARGDVALWQQDFAARADSVVYDRRTGPADMPVPAGASDEREEVRFYRAPLAWFDETQLSGDTLRVTTREGQLDSLLASSRAFIASRDTVLDKIQQLQGDDAVAVFREDSLRRLRVGPQAESIYYIADEDDLLSAAYQGSGDAILFYFRDNKIRRISSVSGIQGTLYPSDLIPENLTLSRYRWEPDRRPRKTELLGAAYVQARLAELEAAWRDLLAPPDPATDAPPTDAAR